MPSHYEILGVGADAGTEEIQSAYDRLSAQCYAGLRDPKTHDECVETLKRITQARDRLLDEAQRAKYNQELKQQETEAAEPPDPSRRFFARAFDVLLFFVVVYPVYRYFADFVFFEDWIFSLIAALVGIGAFILVDTAVTALLGTTPGKWMLSITVQAAGGGKSTRARLVKRNLMAALFGCGLYIPPVCLVTMAVQQGKVKKNGLSGWDRACGTEVVYEAIRKYRLLLLIPVLVLVLIDLFSIF